MTDRISVLVEHGREWHRGTLRSTHTADDGTVTCLVTWRIEDGHLRIDRFPQCRVARFSA